LLQPAVFVQCAVLDTTGLRCTTFKAVAHGCGVPSLLHKRVTYPNYACSVACVSFEYCSTTGLDYSGIQPQKQVTSTPNPLAAAAAAAGATPGPGRLAGATPGTAMVGGTPGRAIAGVASTPGGLAAALGATPGVLWVVRWTTHRGASLEQQSAKHTLRI
jgi:hypothetical protein